MKSEGWKGFEMKSILVGFVLLVLICGINFVFANHVATPLVPNEEYFAWEGTFLCEEFAVSRFSYLTIEKTKGGSFVDILWVKYIILVDDDEIIRSFVVSKLTFGALTEHWIDFDANRQSDGHIDEYFPSTRALILKYKKPCDIIKR